MMNNSSEVISNTAVPDTVGREAQLLDCSLAIVNLLMVVAMKGGCHPEAGR